MVLIPICFIAADHDDRFIAADHDDRTVRYGPPSRGGFKSKNRVKRNVGAFRPRHGKDIHTLSMQKPSVLAIIMRQYHCKVVLCAKIKLVSLALFQIFKSTLS